MTGTGSFGSGDGLGLSHSSIEHNAARSTRALSRRDTSITHVSMNSMQAIPS